MDPYDHSILENSSFLHGPIVSEVQMKCCLTLLHYLVSTKFSSLSLELIFSLSQLEPKFDDLPVTLQTSFFF